MTNTDSSLNDDAIDKISNNNENNGYILDVDNQKNLNCFVSNDGNKISLSGIDLSTLDGKILLNNTLEKFPYVSELIINKCNLEKMPGQVLSLQNLSYLDIRENNFSDFKNLINELSQIKKLSNLFIDITDQDQVLITLTQLPKITLLNGKPTKDAVTIVDVDLKDIEDISLQNEIDDYNEILNRFNEKEPNQEFTKEFQQKIYKEGEIIKECLNKNVPNYMYANITLKSQFELQKKLAAKYLSFLDENDSLIGNIIFKIIFITCDKLVRLINNLYPKIEGKTDILRNQLETAWKAATELADYESQYKILKNEKQILEFKYNEIIKKQNGLEKENQIMAKQLFNTDALDKNRRNNIRNFKNKLNSNLYQKQNKNKKSTKNYTDNSNNLNNNTSTNNNNFNPNKKLLSLKMLKDIMNEMYNSKAFYDKKCDINKVAKETLEQHMYTFLNNKYGLKNLVIDWASAIIKAIKFYSNEDSEIKLFGKILRNEQEENSRLILTKLKDNIAELLEYYIKSKYPFKSKEEIEVLVENKKNGMLLEEEWKGIIYYIYNFEDSQNLENKIYNYIRERKSNLNIPANFEKESEEMPERFITYQNHISLNNTDINLSNSKDTLCGRKLTREEIYNLNMLKEFDSIYYNDFIELVCEYQIKMRENYLKNFVKLFKKVDKDNDGIINEKEFISLVKEIPYCQKNLDQYVVRFLAIIDPYNNKKITFNECIALFSSEIIDENNISQGNVNPINEIESSNIGLNIQTETTLLDKICLNDN